MIRLPTGSEGNRTGPHPLHLNHLFKHLSFAQNVSPNVPFSLFFSLHVNLKVFPSLFSEVSVIMHSNPTSETILAGRASQFKLTLRILWLLSLTVRSSLLKTSVCGDLVHFFLLIGLCPVLNISQPSLSFTKITKSSKDNVHQFVLGCL